jgi:hypoxanthine phosphoribosyltransferase
MKKQYITNKDHMKLVLDICRQISNSSWKPDYVVGITRGGLLPAIMISQYFNIPCETLKISLRDGADQESNLWIAEDAFGHSEAGDGDPLCKNILIMDDINDSGATFNWLIRDWPSGCLPNHERWNNVWNKNVKFAVLVDNLASKCNVKMDYVGMEINKAEDDIWIEFPWENWWK